MPEKTRATAAIVGDAAVAADPAPLALARCAVRGPDPGLRGAVRPAPAPDPARAGRPLRGLPRRDRRRLPGRARPAASARPRRRHRVPPHRRHPRRAQGPAPAARRRRRRPRRGAGPLGGARPAARPAARVQDVQGRRRRARSGSPTTPAGRTPAPPGPRTASSTLTPDLLAGVTAGDLRAAFLRAVAPKPVPRIDLDHVAPIRASVTDAVAELLDELPRVGRITFRQPHRRRSSTGSTSSCGSSPCSSCSSRAWSTCRKRPRFGEIEIVWLGVDADVRGEPVDVYEG